MEMVLTCKGCSKKFSVPYRENRKDTIKYCSLDCYNSTKRKSVICKECGKSFVVKLCSERVFCCQSCYAKNRKKQKPVHRCEVCSKEFETTSTRKDTARFCSKECMSKDESWKQAISEKQTKNNHWRWAGGKSRATLNAYSAKEYRRIFVEYMYFHAPTHPFLFRRNGKLTLARHVHIHHIDKDVTNNDVSNLLAVTIDAHAKIHHSGRKPDPWECWPSNPDKW